MSNLQCFAFLGEILKTNIYFLKKHYGTCSPKMKIRNGRQVNPALKLGQHFEHFIGRGEVTCGLFYINKI